MAQLGKLYSNVDLLVVGYATTHPPLKFKFRVHAWGSNREREEEGGRVQIQVCVHCNHLGRGGGEGGRKAPHLYDIRKTSEIFDPTPCPHIIMNSSMKGAQRR